MRFSTNHHLGYCTNIHRGNSWDETFDSLQKYTLAVKQEVSPDEPYAIGLRLSAQAAKELADKQTLHTFQKWLDTNNCYTFTINGFPYGNFHGRRVKEQVYLPDWTSPERLEYTNLLFELLCQLLPEGAEGSVSTVPGSFKRFIKEESQQRAIRDNIFNCVDHIDKLGKKHHHDLHLGLEPEPLGLFETSQETVDFFEQVLTEHPGDERILRCLGVNYDTCHLAVEYEEAKDAFARFTDNHIRISKIHLSSALKVRTLDPETLQTLSGFCEETYLHQVIANNKNELERFEDLDIALQARASGIDTSEEWRIHFHIPLHCEPQKPLESTADHILATLDIIQENPELCHHFEMETYTWEVLPADLHSNDVVKQLVKEYEWTIGGLKQRGLI